MSGKKLREGGKFRFTLGEMLVGIVLFAIPLAYWSLNVRGYRYSPLSPLSQKMSAANPKLALSMQKNNDTKNTNRLQAYKITSYIYVALSSITFAAFLMIRRSRRSRRTLVADPVSSSWGVSSNGTENRRKPSERRGAR
jgi:hypothetical protein